MQLESERILLRKMEPEDLEFLYSIENNSDFWYCSETKSPYSRWELKQYIENYSYDIFTTKELRLMICDKHSQKVMGVVDLFEYHPLHNRCGIGIIISPEYANKGLATEVVMLVRDYVFETLLANQLWCMVDVENKVSIALFEKCGFVRCGELKQWKRSADGYKDVIIFQSIKK